MANSFASKERALGICDRCGWTYKLKQLKEEYLNLERINILTCPSCWDPDHPQNQVGRYRVNDPQAIQNARPDTGEAASTGLNGWDPVLGVSATGKIGRATIA